MTSLTVGGVTDEVEVVNAAQYMYASPSSKLTDTSMVDFASVVELGNDNITLVISGGGAKVGARVGWDVG